MPPDGGFMFIWEKVTALITRRERNNAKKKRNKKIMVIVLLICFMAVSMAAGYYWFSDKPASSGDVLGAPQGKSNILVLGVDERADDVGRSDTMFIATIDNNTHNVSLLSVPRDTRVKIQGHGWEKINHAYAYGGHTLSKQTVESLLGFRIDHFVIINFASFYKIIDAIGGIDINVDKRMYYSDPYDNLLIDLQPGLQHMDGKTAIQYVRYRDEEGDIGRIERQQKFIKAALEKIQSPSIIPKIPGIIKEVASVIKTDMSIPDMLSSARIFNVASKLGINAQMVPGKPAYIDDVSYWIPDIAALRKYITQVLGVTVDERYTAATQLMESEYKQSIPKEMKILDKPVVKSTQAAQEPLKPKVTATKSVRAEVINGSGDAAAGNRIASMLRSKGIEVSSISNSSLSSRTTIVSHTTDGSIINKIDSLPFNFSLEINKDDNASSQVTVIIGKDNAGK